MRAAILILILAGPWSAAASATPRATIDLLPQAEIQGDTVVLGQVARLHSGDLDLMRRLVHLPLGRAPRPGEVALLPQEGLRLWIRRQTGLTGAEVDLHGSPEARVLAAARRVKGEAIGQAAVAAWRRWAGANPAGAGDVQVRVPVRDVDVAGGAVRLEPRPIEHGAARTQAVVWVEIWSGDAIVRTVPVSLRVPASAVDGGSAAGADTPLLHAAAGRPSGSRGPAEVLGVVRGEWATLRSVAGPIVLEMAVEVLQDGRAGDKVRVRQRGTGGPVLARVVGPGQVELVP